MSNTNDMTNEEIQRLFDGDKHTEVKDDHLRVEKLAYALFITNDTEMDILRELTIELQGQNLYHRDIKNKIKELRDLVHKNHINKRKDHKCWDGKTDDELDAIASDNSVLTALVKKFVGLSNKITFFGGYDASIGQKIWAIHPKTGKLVLVEIDSARGIVDCLPKGEIIGKIELSCTRISEKTSVRTKDSFTVDAIYGFLTKEKGLEYLKSKENEKK